MLLSVKKRQTYLKELGFYNGKIDGIDGKQTKEAYKELQAKYFTRNGDIDGIYGKDTDIILVNAYRVKTYCKNFKLEEFRCLCGRKYCSGYPEYLDAKMLKVLQKIRDKYGATTIESGLRCEKHNSVVGGIRASRHLNGKAVDFKNSGTTSKEKRIDTINWVIKQTGTRYVYCNGYARTNFTTSHPVWASMSHSIHFDVY